MKPILLIAGNFVREQRWPLLFLILWVLGIGIVAAFSARAGDVEDVLFFVKQQAFYGIAFTTFLAAAAVHTERRSRRILGVLSKGITRTEYLAGLIIGVFMIGAIYVAAMGAVGAIVMTESALPLLRFWEVLAMLMAALLLTTTVAMLFSTMTTPLFATVATALAIGVPPAIEKLSPGQWQLVLPVYALMDHVMGFRFQGRWPVDWTLVAWACLESVGIWLLSAWIFGRRDIAVAIE
jgi:hypothetical protein